MRKDLPLNSLGHLNFAVFGLGDSSYEKFNFVGKRLFRRLSQLGGSPLCNRGDGDDQHKFGVDGALVPFLEQLWPAIDIKKKALQLQFAGYRQLPPLAILKPCASVEVASIEKYYNAELVQTQRISAVDSEVKDVRHLVFKTDLTHQPGDVAVLYPENADDDVEELLEVLGWTEYANIDFAIQPNRPDFCPPTRMERVLTLFQLLKVHLDIVRVPSRFFFSVIKKYVTKDHPLAEQHLEKLLELSEEDVSEAGLDSFLDYVWRPKRRPAEILRDFGSLKVPLDCLFDLFPWIKPRSFSIASYTPGEIHIALAIVRFRTIMKTDRMGLCSTWLANLQQGSKVNMAVKKGSMRILGDANSPLLLLCSGTGIAPMRSFIQQIALSPGRKVCLVFGCRSLTKDALFLDELQVFVEAGWLQIIAYGSRDQAQKIYLQDLIRRNSETIQSFLLDPSCHVYLSGNSKLPAAVKKAIKDICSWDDTEFNQALRNRYHTETWS